MPPKLKYCANNAPALALPSHILWQRILGYIKQDKQAWYFHHTSAQKQKPETMGVTAYPQKRTEIIVCPAILPLKSKVECMANFVEWIDPLQ